ncbi:hypothetical protein [Haloplasma contractile]|uniref:Short domain protein n=1 Tax=Haloplasma contractile SSD-17B TaxID=1033810 RepID=F7PT15_9MOLU|nr:hypothetical protein [Haloplasma contractile]ERJ12573.1 hypothetical protein HLPCO_001559 [Haloplasma contractile SSD-17B]
MDNMAWIYILIIIFIFVIIYSVIKHREASRYTIEEEIRNLKNRRNDAQNSRVNQLNNDERYKTNKPKNDIYSKQDYNRMVKNIKSMYKQGIISEGEYKEQLGKIKEGNF